MYDVHLGLIGKCIVDVVLVLIELFPLGVLGSAVTTVIHPWPGLQGAASTRKARERSM